jgi:general secretion pathway protein K
MLVAALAATVAVALAAAQQRWFADVANRRDQVQAQSLALAGVQWARQIIADDARSGTLDYLGEPWSFPLPPTPIANGSIEGRIEDAQARLNLNNAAQDGLSGEAERARLGRLFTARNVDPKLVGVLAAEPPLLRTAELAYARGATAATWPALDASVSALPARTPLNINTAGADAIAAAMPGIAPEDLAAFIAERARKPFSTMAELRERMPRGVTLADSASLAFASSYFIVTVRSLQGDAVAQARALLRREGRAWPVVVWQVLE